MATESLHELCCLIHKNNRIPIFGNYSLNGRINLTGNYTIHVRKEDYDELRGLLNCREPCILNSDRKIEENNGMLSFVVSGGEYAHLASWGKKSTKENKTKESVPQPNTFETYNRARISENAKEFWRNLGSKRRTAHLVPPGYRSVRI